MSMDSDSTKHTSPSDREKISVVVPSYNHASFIEKCLRSIIKQTLAPSQLIVIDDGSSDDSPKIIERTLKEYPFPCELIARPNKGLCATLNEGLERCHGGKYFAYLGSDDAWLPNFLQARVELLESRPARFWVMGMLTSSMRRIASSNARSTGRAMLTVTLRRCSCAIVALSVRQLCIDNLS